MSFQTNEHVFTNDDTCRNLLNNIVALILSIQTPVEKWFSTSGERNNNHYIVYRAHYIGYNVHYISY